MSQANDYRQLIGLVEFGMELAENRDHLSELEILAQIGDMADQMISAITRAKPLRELAGVMNQDSAWEAGTTKQST